MPRPRLTDANYLLARWLEQDTKSLSNTELKELREKTELHLRRSI